MIPAMLYQGSLCKGLFLAWLTLGWFAFFSLFIFGLTLGLLCFQCNGSVFSPVSTRVVWSLRVGTNTGLHERTLWPTLSSDYV